MLKDELRNIISGKNEVRNGTAIQTISCYLKRSAGASKVAKDEKHFKKQETEVLKEYVTKNNLWTSNIDTSNYVSEGVEQKVYLKDGEYVLKLNDGIFYTRGKIILIIYYYTIFTSAIQHTNYLVL